MKPLSECKLYAFVDTAWLRGRDAASVAQQLCDGGADLVQLRAKESPLDEVRRLAEAVLPVTRRAAVGLVLNDHLQLAAELGTELCHLGQEDFFGANYRQVSELPWKTSPASPRPRIGLSTHAPEQAQRAVAAGADYVAIGPVFATGTKPQAKPVTLEYVRWASANIQIPWFAIGGITLRNLPEVLAAGAERICVVSAILNADVVAAECRKFRAELERSCR